MDNNQFFRKLLEDQKLSKQQTDDLESHRKEVEKCLRNKFGSEPVIRYAGSKAKGTMIAESYDLDIVCYFPHENSMTLKEIYDKVSETLRQEYYIEQKTSAIRIKSVSDKADYHIDVVPGKFISGSTGDAFIYISGYEQNRLQTNIDTHISYVTKSGCQEAIKLMKLWKTRNNLNFKTFVLEIFTVETLKGVKDKNNFPAVLEKLFTSLKDGIKTTSLKDPANSNNTISEILTASDKNLLEQKSAEVVSGLKNKSVTNVACWQKVFDEDDISEKITGGVAIENPQKPWCP